MKRVDLTTSVGRIRHALDNLQIVWRQSSEHWDDAVSKRFEERQLEPMIPKIKIALDAIGRMHLLLTEVQRDCDE